MIIIGARSWVRGAIMLWLSMRIVLLVRQIQMDWANFMLVFLW